MPLKDKLHVEDYEHPNGFKCKQLRFGNQLLGSYTVESNGFLPTGKRKPRETGFDAILDIIATHRRAAVKQFDWIESARDAAFEQQHEFKTCRKEAEPTQ